jgi:peptidylprolyl isomerase
MQYTGIVWASGTVFDSSWTSGSVDFPVGSGQVIAGFDEGLVGQTVGSRVLIAIPPDKGYGAEGNSQAGIAGTDTLVFVVDILDAY